MTSQHDDQLQETWSQRRKRRLKNSIRKRISWVITGAKRLRNQARVPFTGHIRCHGNLFDLRHPRMIQGIRDALKKETYEWREIGMIERHVRKDDRVVELGACIGATCMFLYDLVGEDALVVYEADPRNLEMAQHNFRINRKNIRCENAILWSGPDRPETVSFSSNENPSSSSLMDRAGSEVTFEIRTKDLEAALHEHRATAIVLDIEGGEVDLFNNAGDMPGVRVIVLETHERVVGKEANQGMLDNLLARGFEIAENQSNSFVVLTRP